MASASYKKIASLLKTPTIKAKFTRKFQSEEPLVHRLYSDVHKLIETLLGRVCTATTVKRFSQTSSIDPEALFIEINILPFKDIVLRGEVKQELSKLKNNERDRLKFLQCVQAHYIAGCKHLMQKGPCSSKLVKALRCLQPGRRKTQESITEIITVAKSLPLDVPEDLLQDEWKIMQCNDEPEVGHLRIDVYWSRLLENAGDKHKFEYVPAVLKAALTLSHGNADVERRFSVSRWALTEDRAAMAERTLNSLLTIKDALRLYKNEPHLIPMTKRLITLARSAYMNYNCYLEKVRREEAQKQQEKNEADKFKKEVEEKKNKAQKERKTIEDMEKELVNKRESHARAKEVSEKLFLEASGRLKKAVDQNDMKEIGVAQALIETVGRMHDAEKHNSKDVEALQKTVEKRKSIFITSFFSKKPKLQ